MKYGLYNKEEGFRNVTSGSSVSPVWLNTNWADTAKKISTNELEEGYVKERFTNPTLPNQDIAFIQQKLQGERPKIIGILKRARYRRVEKAVDAEIARRAAGGQVGGVQTDNVGFSFGDLFKPTIPQTQPIGGGNSEQSWLESLLGTTNPTNITPTNTNTPTNSTNPNPDTVVKKSNKKILIGVGIGAGVLLIGTVAYFALRKKK